MAYDAYIHLCALATIFTNAYHIYKHHGQELSSNAAAKGTNLPTQQNLPINTNTSQPQPIDRLFTALKMISHHPSSFGVVVVGYTSCKDTFPGLIPGLAGGMPAQKTSVPWDDTRLPSPPPTIELKSATHRVKRLEALVSELHSEVQAQRSITSAAQQEVETLRARVAETEATLARFIVASRAQQRQEHPGYATPSPVCKAARPVRESPVRFVRKNTCSSAYMSFDEFVARFATTAADKGARGAGTRCADEILAPTPVYPKSSLLNRNDF